MNRTRNPQRSTQTNGRAQQATDAPQHKQTNMWIFAPIVILISLACLVTSAYVLFFMDSKEEQAKTNNSSSNTQQQQQTQTAQRSLYYVYSEGKKSTAYELPSGTNEAEKLAEVESNETLDSSKTYDQALFMRSMDMSFDLKNLLYIANNDISTLDIASQKKNTVVDTTPGAETKPDYFELNATPPLTASGVGGLFNPEWARDGKSFSVIAGKYEGSSIELFDIAKKGFVGLGETYQYAGTNVHVTDSLTAITSNDKLATYGLGADRLFAESHLDYHSEIFDDTGKMVYAVLCPEASDTRSCEAATTADLISVSTSGGKYKALTKVAANSAIAMHNGLLYALDADSKAVAINPTSGALIGDPVDVLQIAGVSKAEAQRIDLEDVQRPLVSIYSKNSGDGGLVTVVDVLDKKVVAKLSLAQVSDFYVLGVTP